MRIISRKTLVNFWEKDSQSETALKDWFKKTEKSVWKTPADIKEQYRSASFLSDNRVVFNICGNKYRLIVKINYNFGIAYIRFVGTHKEYDSINAETI